MPHLRPERTGTTHPAAAGAANYSATGDIACLRWKGCSADSRAAAINQQPSQRGVIAENRMA